MSTDMNRPFRLGDWQVDPGLNQITGEDEAIQIEPKMMDLLVFFAHRAGQVVTKQELIDGVWACQYVADSALSRCLALLRRALGDDARKPRFIATIPKRGYRLVAEVDGLETVVTRPETATSRFRVLLDDVEIVLHEAENVIGRSSSAAVRIDSPRVSWRHAQIAVRGLRAMLEDLDSKNGTLLNGRRLMGAVDLSEGDLISIGSKVLEFRITAADAETETAPPE